MLFTSNQERGVVLLRSELTTDGPLRFSRLRERVEGVSHRSELFTYCERFRASRSGPEAWTVSLPSEQRRPSDLQ